MRAVWAIDVHGKERMGTDRTHLPIRVELRPWRRVRAARERGNELRDFPLVLHIVLGLRGLASDAACPH